MKKSVKLFALLLVLAMVFSMAACGNKNETPASPATPASPSTPATPSSPSTPAAPSAPAAPQEDRHYAVDADTVVLGVADETPSLTPREHNAVEGSRMNNLTYNELMMLDNDLAPIPCLAESYTVEEQADGSVKWTFKLRQGVKFHDGTEMHAEDVVASFAEAKASSYVATYASWDQCYEEDPYTVILTTPEPSAALLYDLCGHGNAIVPKALLDAGNDFNSNPVGTGPYKFVEWKISESVSFTRFDDYFLGAAPIKNVTYKIIPEGSARTIALQAHEIDYAVSVDTNDADLVLNDASLQSIFLDSISHSWLTINNTVTPFDNQLVRKAMNAAINKEDVVTVAFNGYAIPAPGQTPYGMLGFDATGYDTYDVEKAKKYAADSGVDLSTVSFEVICSDDTKRRAGQVVQDCLNSNLGMTVELVSMDLATYLSETAAGHFQGFIGGYSSDNMMSFLKGVYHSSNIGASNKTRTNDPHLDELIDKACATVDNNAREEVLKETSRYLNDLCCQIPLWQPQSFVAGNKFIKDLTLRGDGRYFIEHWSWE